MLYKNARDPVHRFYSTQQWQKARNAYWKSVGGLCEECLKKGLCTPAEQVHHIKPLRPEDLDNPALTTGFNNLQALCARCHEEKHGKHAQEEQPRRYVVAVDGTVKFL